MRGSRGQGVRPPGRWAVDNDEVQCTHERVFGDPLVQLAGNVKLAEIGLQMAEPRPTNGNELSSEITLRADAGRVECSAEDAAFEGKAGLVRDVEHGIAGDVI